MARSNRSGNTPTGGTGLLLEDRAIQTHEMMPQNLLSQQAERLFTGRTNPPRSSLLQSAGNCGLWTCSRADMPSSASDYTTYEHEWVIFHPISFLSRPWSGCHVTTADFIAQKGSKSTAHGRHAHRAATAETGSCCVFMPCAGHTKCKHSVIHNWWTGHEPFVRSMCRIGLHSGWAQKKLTQR
jgi:hypothetical protein